MNGTLRVNAPPENGSKRSNTDISPDATREPTMGSLTLFQPVRTQTTLVRHDVTANRMDFQ